MQNTNTLSNEFSINLYKQKLIELDHNFKNLLNDIVNLQKSLTLDEMSKNQKLIRSYKSLEKTTIKNKDDLFKSKDNIEFLKKLPHEINDLIACYAVLSQSVKKEEKQSKQSEEILHHLRSMCCLFSNVVSDILDHVNIIHSEQKSLIF